jgi:hypothetical protein
MIYILVRRTTDWEREDVVLAQLPAEFVSKVEAWNAVFTIPYHVFRHRLKRIAQLNLSRVENAIVARFEEIPPGALVVPVDDDDWFSPDLANVLERHVEGDYKGYYWNVNLIEPPATWDASPGRVIRSAAPPPGRCRHTFETNNFALLNVEDLLPRNRFHTKADACFAREPHRYKRFDANLSLWNLSIASQSAMNPRLPGLGRKDLVRSYERYASLYRSFDAPDVEWSVPYVAMMAELMDELKLR